MIAFRVDGNKLIGMGHYIRCMTVARSLLRAGEKVIFICSNDSNLPCFYNKEIDYIILNNHNNNKPWDANEVKSLIIELGINLLIIDSYRIDASDFLVLRGACRTVYIDDLNTYNCNVDCVVNFNIEANETYYLERQIDGRDIFTGLKYYPIRDEILDKKKLNISKTVKKVMISSGSTDPEHCIYNILLAISPDKYKKIKFIILNGLYFDEDYIERLYAKFGMFENISFLEWGNHFVERLASVDLLISSGSSIVLEALSMNVPCITFQFADNHNIECVDLNEKGIADWAGIYTIDNYESTNIEMRRLFEKNLGYAYRLRKEGAYKGLFDGLGTERLVKVLLDQIKEES